MTPQELKQQIKNTQEEILSLKEEFAQLNLWADEHYPHRCDECGGTGGELQGGFCSSSQEEELWFEECDHCNHETDEGEYVNPLNVNGFIDEPFEHESAPPEIVRLSRLDERIYDGERGLYYLDCELEMMERRGNITIPSWGLSN